MTADDHIELPPNVLEALGENRRILAIKLLREQSGLDLKGAKERVDAYLKGHPHLAAGRRPVEITGRGTLILLGLLILAAWVGYQLVGAGN